MYEALLFCHFHHQFYLFHNKTRSHTIICVIFFSQRGGVFLDKQNNHISHFALYR